MTSAWRNSWSDAPQVIVRTSTASPQVIEQHVGKEVARPEEKETAEDWTYGLPTGPLDGSVQYPDASASSLQEPKKPRRSIFVAVGIAVFLLICIGVGLGVGLGLRRQSKKYVILTISIPCRLY